MSSDYPNYGAVLAKNVKLDQTGLVFHNTSDDSKTVTLKLATGAMSAGNVDVTIPLSATALGAGGSSIPDGDSAGDALLWSGSAWVQKAFSGDATIDANGALTLANNAVESAMIASNAVSADKIASGAVTADKIGAGAVAEAKLANDAVSADKIASGAVAEAKLANGAVTADKLGAGSVVEAKLGAGAVVEAKLGAGAVTADKIGAGAVAEAKLANDAVSADKIAIGAVAEAKLASNAVSTAKIADDAVTNAKLATNSVNADSCGITTAGVAEASKACILDAQKDLTGLREFGCAEVQVNTKWKMKQDGNNLIFQYWTGSAWVTKQTFTPT